MAQPQPALNPTLVRFPPSPPAGLVDKPVAIGLWQEQIGLIPGEGGKLDPKKVFVFGTRTMGNQSFLCLTRYDLDGSNPLTVTWPSNDQRATTTVRAARAMTIPVTPVISDPDVAAAEGRVYVTGRTNGPAGTTDIVTLAYDFNLNLKWMKTYSYNDPSTSPFYGDDDPVAITTNQNRDWQIEGLDYDYVAVVGSSQSHHHGKDYVTLCYHKTEGVELMPPARYTSAGVFDDVPADIIATHGGPGYIAVTGTSIDPYDRDPNQPGIQPGNNGLPVYLTLAYQIESVDPEDPMGNGHGVPYFPRAAWGSFSGNYLGFPSYPVRMEYLKQSLVITGRTMGLLNTSGDYDAEDMFTVLYYISSTSEPPFSSDQLNFQETFTGGADRFDAAVDMDALYTTQNTWIAITGRSTSVVTGKTEVATMLYNVGGFLARWWPDGARWARPVSSGGENDDRGVSVRLVEAYEELPGSLFNVYVTSKSRGAGSDFDFTTIKYGHVNPIIQGSNQAMRWEENLLPYYNFSSNGVDSPVQIAPQYLPRVTSSEKRRLFITGQSWGGSSAEDWATQFTVEQLP